MFKKFRFMSDYAQLRAAILRQTAILLLAAAFCIALFYSLFLYQHFANFTVYLLDRLIYHDFEQAVRFYQVYIRNFMEVYVFLAIAFLFILMLRFYLYSFTRYFNEINGGVNAILDRGPDVHLSPELSATERKINSIKHELLRQEQASREAEQRKNDLVMYLAHDIRTPLTSVVGYLNLLEEAPDMPAEQREKYVRIALDKAYRLERMVDEFFEITRYNLQNITVERETLHLEFMLCQLTDELTPVLLANGNTVRLQVPDGLTVSGDPDKLARVFNNLLKNAAAYSEPGTEIRIDAREEGDFVVISFRNRGRNIPPEKLAALFERFYRMDDARTSGAGGAGLGLAIAKEIVLRHGGTIRAESAADTVAFTVSLPRRPPEAGPVRSGEPQD